MYSVSTISSRAGKAMLIQLFGALGASMLLTGIIAVSCWPYTAALKDPYFMIFISDISIYGVGTMFLWQALKGIPKKYSEDKLRLAPYDYVFIVLALYAVATVVNLVIGSFTDLIDKYVDITSAGTFLDTVDSMPLPLLIIATSIIGPVCEELIFRGLMLPRLCYLNERFGIIVSAAAFAIMHGELSQTAYAFITGIVLAVIVRRTGRLRDAIGIHIAFNAINMVAIVPLSKVSEMAATIVAITLAVAGVGAIIAYRDTVRRESRVLEYHDDLVPIWGSSRMLDAAFVCGGVYCVANTIIAM